MSNAYDNNNVFYKIINKKISSKILYEDQFVIAIKDIQPVSPTHILVITKNSYINFNDFILQATNEEISHYFKSIQIITSNLNITSYRIISNNGDYAGQTVMHFHTHIIAEKKLTNLI